MVAALLHDVLDDTDVEFGEIEQLFGAEVRCRSRRLSVSSCAARHALLNPCFSHFIPPACWLWWRWIPLC